MPKIFTLPLKTCHNETAMFHENRVRNQQNDTNSSENTRNFITFRTGSFVPRKRTVMLECFLLNITVLQSLVRTMWSFFK